MLYTVGIWMVKAGREEDFATVWRALNVWTVAHFAGASGTLLRDREHPNRFISFGPWPDEATIAAWRQSSGFSEHLAQLRELLDDFTPGTYDPIA